MCGRKTIMTLAAALWLGGCSMQTVMDKFVPPARQQELADLAAQFCTAPDAVLTQMQPETRAQAGDALRQAHSQCVDDNYRYRVTSFHMNVNRQMGGPSTREEQIVLVAGTGPWSELALRMVGVNGAKPLITDWRIVRMNEKPESLVFADNWERSLTYIRSAGVVIALALIALVVWLVRRTRAKRDSGRMY